MATLPAASCSGSGRRGATTIACLASGLIALGRCGTGAIAAGPAQAARELWVLDAGRLAPAEQTLAATLQGVLNEKEATLWLLASGMSAVVLEQLRAEGVALRQEESPWRVVEAFRGRIAGAIVYDANDESLNVATSLCGPRHALAVEAGLLPRAKDAGMKVLDDVRGVTEAQALARHHTLFARGIAVHQPPEKHYHIRDFAVARHAFTFATEDPARRTATVRALGPLPLVFGWGKSEERFVAQVSAGGGVVIPSDWSMNLSALQHLPAEVPPRRLPAATPPRKGERVVAFVMSDGDNVQWIGGEFVAKAGFWASRHRGQINMTWEMPPVLVEVAPRVLAHFHREASLGAFSDELVAGPSGIGYYFPHASPDRLAWARRTAQATAKARMPVVSVLNRGGGMDETRALLEQPEVEGVLYKDFVPYNKRRGAISWHAGKPCVSYRFLLWEGKPEQSPEGVARGVAALPAAADVDPDSYALVNVHAWSFAKGGGPMEAVRRTVDLLPAGTRVVTAGQLIGMLRAQFTAAPSPPGGAQTR